jgi:RimJ/RimL family protein N-acetyltransferase
MGLHLDNTLVAVAAWNILPGDPVVWRSIVVAVAEGHQRRGYGTRLKGLVVEKARTDGAAAITSVVHRDNLAMWRINEQHGAIFDPMNRLEEYFTATISA